MHLTDVASVHPYSVRICHWINLIACAYLIWSGIHIFLDFPELYWGHTGYRDYPAAFRLADWGLSGTRPAPSATGGGDAIITSPLPGCS